MSIDYTGYWNIDSWQDRLEGIKLITEILE